MNNRILLLIFLGLSIRLLLIFLPAFKIDADDWFAWSARLSHFNFSQFYSKDIFTDYTPGYLYILALLGLIKNQLNLSSNIFYLLLKIPAIISDLIIGLFIYKEVKNYISPKLALYSLILILFNPVVIFNSSIWGQIDSVLTLFMLATVITLKRNRLVASSLLLGLSLLIKPQAISLIPVFFFFLIRHLDLSRFLKLVIPALLVIFILTIPFFPNQTLINLALHIIKTSNEYPYTSVNAYNLWGVTNFWISDKQVWHTLSYQTWGYVLLASYWLLISYFYFKKKLSIYALAALATLGFFFLPTRVHERYLYPALVFLILFAAMSKSRLLLILTGILSFLHLLNLYYVYIYYNEIYLKLPKILYNPSLYNLVASNSKVLSLISVIIFILISIVIFKYDTNPQKD